MTQPLHSTIAYNGGSGAPIPGMIYPTTKGMIAATPRESAIETANMNANRQALANSLLSGGRRRYKSLYNGGSTSAIVVPQFHMNYTSQGGVGQDPNSIIQNGSKISTQGAANAAYDQAAFIKGGYRVKRGGKSRKSSRKNKRSHKRSRGSRSRVSKKSRRK